MTEPKTRTETCTEYGIEMSRTVSAATREDWQTQACRRRR